MLLLFTISYLLSLVFYPLYASFDAEPRTLSAEESPVPRTLTPEPSSQNPEDVIATIGNEEVRYSEIQKAAQGLNRFLKENFDQHRDWRLDFIRQYVARRALAKKAVAEGLDKDPEIQYALEQSRRTILSDKVLSDKLSKVEFTLEDIQKYYEQNKARYRTPGKVKVSYLRKKDKASAEKVFAQLNEGKGFDKIARKDAVKLDKWIVAGFPPEAPELAGIPPEALDRLVSSEAGDHSSPVAISGAPGSPEEYFIFRIDAKEASKDRPFDEVKKQAEFEYARELQARIINETVLGILAEEKVVIHEKDIQ